MKILIPTAKEMNTEIESYPFAKLSDDSKSVLKVLGSMTVEQLSKIYKIKDSQAAIEKTRLESLVRGDAKRYTALNLFDGLMYRNIKRIGLTDKEIAYLKANLFITSSFYGIINVYDKISEHRLDFQQRVEVNEVSLKKYWQEKFDAFVEKDELVISLLSSEFEEVFSKKMREKFVKIMFLNDVDGELKGHSTISKKARGKFISKLVEKDIVNLEDLKSIVFDNYRFNENLSEKDKFIFVAKLR